MARPVIQPRKTSLRSVLCAAALALIMPISSADAGVFYPENYRLANGMDVVIVHNPLAPAVAQMVWYKVGAVDDPKGKSGLAHYLEHMMFKGTKTVADGEFNALIAAQGGEENAFTTRDTTSYHETIAADRLGLVMQLEADRMNGLAFDPSVAASELSVVLSERQERTENNPQGLFAEKLAATLYGEHPYGRPVIGWRDELASITPEDAMAFYRSYYAPDNAILVVSGDVQTQEVLRLASATFGKVPASGKVKSNALPPVQKPSTDRVEMQDSRVTQPIVTWHSVLPQVKPNTRMIYALDVLSEVLSGGEIGLLPVAFVQEQPLASSVSVSSDTSSRGPVTFSWTAVPRGETDVRDLENRIKSFLVKLSRKGIKHKEIQAAKQRLQDAAIFARDDLMVPAHVLGQSLAVGETIDVVEQWPNRIRAVTDSDVNTALRLVLNSAYFVTGILEPTQGGQP